MWDVWPLLLSSPWAVAAGNSDPLPLGVRARCAAAPLGRHFCDLKKPSKKTPAKSSIVETLASKQVARMVPKRSLFSILRILWTLKPLSIDSSVLGGLRDSVFYICSSCFLTPFSDLDLFCFWAIRWYFGVPKGSHNSTLGR